MILNNEVAMALRLVLAGGLGSIIGYQREHSGKPAGLRTHALISLGAALFTVAGSYAFPSGDGVRITAGIVSGIGFLGAGAILHRHRSIEGLTTAATMWVVAAIGLAAGAGMYLIASVTTALTLIILLIPHKENQ
jgi:putative Mg2+ transporter-C (MgtC) family protein